MVMFNGGNSLTLIGISVKGNSLVGFGDGGAFSSAKETVDFDRFGSSTGGGSLFRARLVRASLRLR